MYMELVHSLLNMTSNNIPLNYSYAL